MVLVLASIYISPKYLQEITSSINNSTISMYQEITSSINNSTISMYQEITSSINNSTISMYQEFTGSLFRDTYHNQFFICCMFVIGVFIGVFIGIFIGMCFCDTEQNDSKSVVCVEMKSNELPSVKVMTLPRRSTRKNFGVPPKRFIPTH